MTRTRRGDDGAGPASDDVLGLFGPATAAWFRGAFDSPTPAQEGSWRAAADGRDALVVAPTGSGKTLAAFLWSLDRLAAEPVPDDPLRRCRVLYISPLKALAVDVERNLRAPLTGIGHACVRLGLPVPEIQVGIRSGDSSPEDRRRMARRPPDILITTPESLFLLLTSQARESLRGVETVIVDEVHAVAATKRGAHLALSLERLDELLERPARRVGLSATVRPVEEVARFLGGPRDVLVVQPPGAKQVEVTVEVPVQDMATLGQPVGRQSEGASAAGAEARVSIWPAVEARVAELVGQHRSTIVFANSRRSAERLCARLNEIAAGGNDDLDGGPARPPAETMAQAGQGDGIREGAPVMARAHHGSVSKEQRAQIEDELKAGRLPAVVATSSLELGIDMGAVDLVVQVESPPSVASGLQRVGRAGHQVGAVSRGILFPKYRGDLVQSAVVAERMRSGRIEAMTCPRNPLDVLAQQIVAMTAMEPWQTDGLLALVRRAAPFAELPDSAFEAVLDMLAGRYPSDDFAELRPRIVWDRVTDTVTSRPGSQRLAVTSGGTIPDRGLFGVFLVGEKGSRVGELDEEMVYESRVGDVFLLGSSSWRIEEITHDRVLVSPAPGQPGKMPFWHGDSLGRPLELGKAVGEFVRELGALEPTAATARVTAAGLDTWAGQNLLAYLAEQKVATGYVPDDRTIVVERFRDELGDWRVVVHSCFGGQVNAPWALALAARLRERHGLDAQAMHSDDGIVLRVPDLGGGLDGGPGAGFGELLGDSVFDDLAPSRSATQVPGGEAVVLDADDVERIVIDEVGGSALFASRFRECAARALLLPKRDPRKRAPLWQQRQRAAQLLGVASRFDSFPVVLETLREVLQDVFDVPGLVSLMRDLESGAVRLVDVETPSASPFARSLMFGYVGAFMYEGDTPLAERRAAALQLDPGLLAELLGRAELRELIDPEALDDLERSLQRLDPDRPARHAEDAADLLRVLGDLSTDEAGLRGVRPEWLTELQQARRALSVRIAGQDRWIAVEDAGRVQDALGTPLPVGVPEAFTAPVADPLGDLVSRFARTHGPFTSAAVAGRFGLGRAVVDAALARLSGAGRVVKGEFRPGGSGTEWCDAEVLRRVRRQSLARLRQEVEPVEPGALAAFLPSWQALGSGAGRGLEGLLRAVEQLQGAPVPASALESLVLPARVRDWSPALLDQACAAGEVLWCGRGQLPGNDGWVSLHLADTAELTLAAETELAASPVQQAMLDALTDGQALFFRTLVDRLGEASAGLDDEALAVALWELVWAGRLTNDTIGPLRAAVGRGRTTHRGSRAPVRARSARPSSGRMLRTAGLGGGGRVLGGRSGPEGPRSAARSGPAHVGGRWSLLPQRVDDPTVRLTATAELLLDRHGVVTRGAVAAERVPGGFAAVYQVLSAMEDAGHCRRGYFVEGLGAAQFAVPGAVDRLRAVAADRQSRLAAAEGAGSTPGLEQGWESVSPWAVQTPGGMSAGEPRRPPASVLAATDPASPWGAALPWPGAGRDQVSLLAVGAVGAVGAGSSPAASSGGGPAPDEGPEGPAGRGGGPPHGHRPGRKAGAVVVDVDGDLILYLERGGKTLLTWSTDPGLLEHAARALSRRVLDGRLGTLTVEKADGVSLVAAGRDHPVTVALEAAGFAATPSGLRLRPAARA